jgi:ribosome modulation factor
MFDEVDRTPAVDKAFADGPVAGAGGKSAQPPYATGTEQEQAWLKGWHTGQADLASGFKKLEPAEASDQVEMEDA